MYPFLVSVNAVAASSGSQGSVVTSSVGLRLASSSDDYETANAAPGRPTAPRAWAALVSMNSLPSSYVAACTNGGLSTGWCIRTNGTSLTANIGNGQLRATPTYNISTWDDDPNVIHGIVCTYSGHTGSGDLILYADREARTSASFSGYTDPSREFVIGGHPDSGFGFDGTIYGFVVCNVVPNSASVQQWFDDCKAAVDVVAFNTGSSSVWSVRQSAFDAPTTWQDLQAVFTPVTKSNTPVGVDNPSFSFAW